MTAHLKLVDSDPIEGERFDMLPAEAAREHVANALQVLVGHEAQHPAVWAYSPELRNVEALLFKALFLLDGGS